MPALAPIAEASSSYVHDAAEASAATMSKSTLSTVRPIEPQPNTRREAYLAWLHERYPTFEPQNDYELVSIVESNYGGPASSALDKQLMLDIAFAVGSKNAEDVGRMDAAQAARTQERLISQARTILDAPGDLTGQTRSMPGKSDSFCRAVPNSPYAIRLVPGLLAQCEWLMDFVDMRTWDPVSPPPEFQIYTPRDGGAMFGVRCGLNPVHPIGLAHALGSRGAGSRAGAETCILRDGQTCMLRRGKGHADVVFRVPVRVEGLNLIVEQADLLDFPGLV